jgi:release factor glutamine methyltransferase
MQTDYRESLARSRQARTSPDRPNEFRMRGRDWDLLDDVFAPVFSPSTEVFLDLLGDRRLPVGGSLLEIGTGCGIIAVEAALAGCRRVVAADINLRAVRNAERNAERHGVTGRVSCRRSDMFAGLAAGERFDLVFWHSNFVLAPPGHRYDNDHDRAYVDVGYDAHRRYLAEAHDWARPGTGRVMLGFSTRGDERLLRRLAADAGRVLHPVAERGVVEGPYTVTYRLIESRPDIVART